MPNVRFLKSLNRELERAELKIEVLYFGGCPNHKPAVEQVQLALRSEWIGMAVDEVEVTDSTTAQQLGFLGSRTIRINGSNVEPETRGLQTFGFSCRTYSDADGRRSALPSPALFDER